MHHVVLCCVESYWILQEANQYSGWTELSGEELHAACNSLLKCLSHARDHAVSVNQTCRPATITQAAACCLGLLLWSWSPVGLGARGVGPRCRSSSKAKTGQTEGGCGRVDTSQGQQRDMRLRYCSTSGTRHWGEPLCSRKGCSSRSVALARSKGSRVSIRSRKSFSTGETWCTEQWVHIFLTLTS